MIKNVKIFFPISLAIFIFFELYLVKGGMFEIGILFYLFYVILLFFIDKNYVITFFVYHLPLVPIIPTDYKLASYIGPHEIIYGIAFLVLSTKVRARKIKLTSEQRLAISFVFFLFFFNMYILFKNDVLGLNESEKTEGFMYLLKNFVRYFLYYMSLVALIKIIYTRGLFQYVITGINYAIISITISMIYTRELIIMGAGVTYAVQRKSVILAGKYERFVGFYGAGGDENSVGIFMVAAFAFYLALYEREKKVKTYAVFMGFAVLGALLTGSRTTFMALSVVLLVFLITNKSGKAKFALLFGCITFYFLFNKQLDMVIQRFTDPSANEAIDPNKTGRVFKWIFYTEWLFKHPETFMFGNQVNMTYKRAPHNYFILVAYKTGIIPLIILFRLLFKLYGKMNLKFSSTRLKNVYYLLPFPFILMTVNSFGSAIYLWLFFPIGAYYMSPESKKNIEN